MRYEDRLSELRLTTLETRRIRADLIEVFKIIKGRVSYCKGIGLIMNRGGRRGHGFKLFKKRFRLDVGKYVIECVIGGMICRTGLYWWGV